MKMSTIKVEIELLPSHLGKLESFLNDVLEWPVQDPNQKAIEFEETPKEAPKETPKEAPKESEGVEKSVLLANAREAIKRNREGVINFLSTFGASSIQDLDPKHFVEFNDGLKNIV